MSRKRRWEPCIYNRGRHTDTFLREYLSDDGRRVLLIAGAGFDPRSTRITELFPESARNNTKAIFLREERPDPDQSLVQRAIQNRDHLMGLIAQSEEREIRVFADDNAVVGGRNGALLADEVSLGMFTDVFIDVSALSIGIAFPIIKRFVEALKTNGDVACNVHIVCCDSPTIDRAITSIPSDLAAPIHGFRGGWGMDDKSRAAILWMPQLSPGKRGVLGRIFQTLRNVQPDTVVCPILPFPSSRPRLSDELIEEYSEELQRDWEVDVRDLIYADEKSPLDLYRTILNIDDARHRVFKSVGGSQIILSPLGSKALSLGALMAALERDFTMLYVESIGYTLNDEGAHPSGNAEDLVHIWLDGDAYGRTNASVDEEL